MWWRLTPATAKDPYWKWSAKDTALALVAGDTGHIVRDQMVQFDSGCIGQEFVNTEIAFKQLDIDPEPIG